MFKLADGCGAQHGAHQVDTTHQPGDTLSMAKTTITHITDDLDGSTDATEVSFSYAGTDYSIDLSKKNKTALEKALKPYLDAATKVPGRSSSSRRAKSSSNPKRDLARVREWAKGQGIEVSERGRVSAAVLEQYDAAN